MGTALVHEQAARLREIVRDPVRFGRALLRHDYWAKQEEILRAIASSPRVAVKACHASGKTHTAAAAVLWWVAAHPDGIAITTAPTWVQVERLLWGEIHRAVRRSLIAWPPLSQTALELVPGTRYAMGLSTNEGVRFQGFHGRVLVVIDEAPGVQADIWEAIDGIRAGGDVRVLALGNPTEPAGPFYDAFRGAGGAGGWQTVTISAFDTPNLAGLSLDDLLALDPAPGGPLDEAVRPYLTTRRWVYEAYHDWGPDSPQWRSRVLGQFPDQTTDALISLAWIEEAAKRRRVDRGSEVDVGIDVAGPGEDETVMAVRERESVIALHAWHDPDPRGKVVAALAPYAQRLRRVRVDAVGLGYHFATHLRDQVRRWGLPPDVVQPVNVGQRARNAERYISLKAEMYWALRDRFARGEIAIPPDPVLVSQLANVRYEHDARGRVVVETKAEARKRGLASPDRAEAVLLACVPAPAEVVPRWQYQPGAIDIGSPARPGKR